MYDPIDKEGGLDARTAEVHMSHSPCSYFYLANAMLTKARILLLDEATRREVSFSDFFSYMLAGYSVDIGKILMQALILREYKEHATAISSNMR